MKPLPPLLRGISLWDPWATMVRLGAKKWETRPFRTKYRGPLLISSTKKTPPAEMMKRECEPFRKVLERHELLGRKLPGGFVLCVVDLTDIISTEEFLRLVCKEGRNTEPDETSFGDYGPGRWAWKLENLRSLKNPVAWKGAQGIWKSSPELRLQVELELL